MEYVATINGEDAYLEISHRMGDVDNGRDGMVWGVASWWVTSVDGIDIDRNASHDIEKLLDGGDVVQRIMEGEA